MPQFIQCNDFLSSAENKLLFEQTLKIEKEFVTAGVIDISNDYPNWRSANVSFSHPSLNEFYILLKELIFKNYRSICTQLDIEVYENYGIDIQLTAHNDGDYYKVHSDSCNEETDNRVLTFVYYFHKSPKSFTGGELVIHGSEKNIIDPTNNMIVFFDPKILHEVQVVNCIDRAFENSRFTLNGWILRT